MDVLAHWVEKIVAVADERDLFHTTEDGYDVGARFDEDDARAILDAIDYRGAVEACADAADLLDELTVYWEVDDLPFEVGSRFTETRDALHRLGGR